MADQPNGTNGNGHPNGLPADGANPASRIPVMNGGGFTEAQARQLDLLVANATTLRDQIFRQLADPRRSVEAECGYPELSDSISVDLFRALYDRDWAACRIVDLFPKECWQITPQIYEDEDAEKATAFEEAWDELEVGVSTGKSWHQDEEGGTLWSYLQRADTLSGIGTFGVLLLGIDDGRNLQDPVEGVVVFNRRIEPIYADGPVWNSAEGILVKDKHGRLRRQIGTRVTNAGPNHPMMPDSPPAKFEMDALEAMVKNEEVVLNQSKWVPAAPNGLDKGGFRTEPVRHKAAFLNDWLTTAERAAQGKANAPTTNADVGGFAPDPVPDVTVNDAWGETTGDAGYGHNSPAAFGKQAPKAGYGQGGNGPTTRARSAQQGDFLRGQGIDPAQMRFQDGKSNNTPRSNTPGTDAQYAWQGAMPPAALAGTDQQYFGVYFGPSEAFPNDGPTGRPKEQPTRKLTFLRPFDESLVQVVRYEWNIRNPRFGMPVMYRITLNDPREQHSGVGLPMATVFVHWSRVIHLADNLQSSEIFGRPRMRPVLNNVLGLRKIMGAAPEGYWKSAFTGYSFETNPQLGGDVVIDKPGLMDMFEQYQNSLQRALVTSGMTVKTLAPTVADPTAQVNVQIQAICVYFGCPQRVFMGSERGELASSQDDSQWNDVKRSRCLMYLTPKVICPFVDRLIAVGVLPEPEGYTVKWPDLEALSDAQKAAIMLQRTQAWAAYVAGNLESTIPPQTYATEFDSMSDEEADEMIEAAKKIHEDQETMTMPPQVGGQPAEHMEGTQAAAEQDQAQQQHEDQLKQSQQQFEQQLDHEDQQADKAAGMAAPGQPSVGDQKIASMAKAQAAQKAKGAPAFKARVGNELTDNGFNPVPALQAAGKWLSQHEDPAPMPGYGQIFVKENGSGEAWYVGGDGDEDGFAKLVQRTLTKIEGIDDVTCEAESFPPRDAGWMQVYPKVRQWTLDDGATLKPKRFAANLGPTSSQETVTANASAELEQLRQRTWRAAEWLGNLKRLVGERTDNLYNPEQIRDAAGRFSGTGEGGASKLQDLHRRIAKPDGGFTYQPLTDDSPTTGYALSPYPERSQAIDASQLTINDLTAYADKNQDLLGQYGHYMGAWHDPASDKVFLDISIVSQDEGHARDLAMAKDQIAYFDLKRGASVTVNPKATSGGVTNAAQQPKLLLVKGRPSPADLVKLLAALKGKGGK